MKPIKSKQRLELNRETLRRLSGAELGQVNGASGHVWCPAPFPDRLPDSVPICPIDGPDPSQVGPCLSIGESQCFARCGTKSVFICP